MIKVARAGVCVSSRKNDLIRWSTLPQPPRLAFQNRGSSSWSPNICITIHGWSNFPPPPALFLDHRPGSNHHHHHHHPPPRQCSRHLSTDIIQAQRDDPACLAMKPRHGASTVLPIARSSRAEKPSACKQGRTNGLMHEPT